MLNTEGLGTAREVTSALVGIGMVIQFAITVTIILGIYGCVLKLRPGVDRKLPWLIALSSLGWLLQDLNNLAVNVRPGIFFGMSCSTASRFTALVSALGCIGTYGFLLMKAQVLPRKLKSYDRMFKITYGLMVAFVAVSVTFSSIAHRDDAQIDEYTLCIYQGENNGAKVLGVSAMMGMLNFACEFACLYLFVKPMRDLSKSVDNTSRKSINASAASNAGFHLDEFRRISRINIQATLMNIVASGGCAMIVAIAVVFSNKASTQVYAVISYVFYGLLATGGLLYCTQSAWVWAKDSTSEKLSTKEGGSSANKRRTSAGAVSTQVVVSSENVEKAFNVAAPSSAERSENVASV